MRGKWEAESEVINGTHAVKNRVALPRIRQMIITKMHLKKRTPNATQCPLLEWVCELQHRQDRYDDDDDNSLIPTPQPMPSKIETLWRKKKEPLVRKNWLLREQHIDDLIHEGKGKVGTSRKKGGR